MFPESSDVCIIGGGVAGVAVARDLATCGYSCVIAERAPAIGGVWAKNAYPGLRLHALGFSYRCTSLAPSWQTEGEGNNDVLYRPTASEIYAYIQQMSEHKLITICPNTSYVSHCKLPDNPELVHVVCDNKAFVCRALVFATGTYHVTSGSPTMPFDPKEVQNGATVVHSANLESDIAAFLGAKKKYIIGASKAAIDILKELDPQDESIVWAHRGHVLFCERGALNQALQAAGPVSQALGTRFASFFSCLALPWIVRWIGPCSGWLIHVGHPLARVPFRGGIESKEAISHVREFVPSQRLLKDIQCNNGVVQLCCQDGSLIDIGPDDFVCMCTGQRTEQPASINPADNSAGIFTCLPLSSQAPTAALYTTHLVLAYLDGHTGTAYHDGRLAQALHCVSTHVQALADRDPWAKFMAMKFKMRPLAKLILPSVHHELAVDYRWRSKWFGKDLDPRSFL